MFLNQLEPTTEYGRTRTRCFFTPLGKRNFSGINGQQGLSGAHRADFGDGLTRTRIGYAKGLVGFNPLPVDVAAGLQQSTVLDSGEGHTKSSKRRHKTEIAQEA